MSLCLQGLRKLCSISSLQDAHRLLGMMAGHALIRSGLCAEFFNHVYGCLYDPDEPRLEPKKVQNMVSWFCGKLWRGGTSSRCSVTFLVRTHDFLGEGTTGWYVNE